MDNQNNNNVVDNQQNVQNQPVVQNVVEPQNVDPRLIKAEVIGELRKEKIGKPLLVVEIFILLFVIMLITPFVTNMLNDEGSTLYKLLHGNLQETVTPVEQKPEFSDASQQQVLANDTSMKYEGLIMKGFSLSGDIINVTMYSYNDVINLDEESYYFEIYSSTNNLLGYIKLSGKLDYQERQYELSSPKVAFNSSLSYYGKVVEVKEFPKADIKSDANGIAVLTCKKDNRTLTYTFMNEYLNSITDNVVVRFDENDEQEYLNSLASYNKKAELLKEISSVVEDADGFIFNANINLDSGFRYPATLTDYDYYELDAEAREISYAMIGKGYECE